MEAIKAFSGTYEDPHNVVSEFERRVIYTGTSKSSSLIIANNIQK